MKLTLIHTQLLLYLVLAMMAGIWSGNSIAQTAAVANGQTVTIDAHGVCQKVTNNGGPTTMVPYRSAAEWSSFRTGRAGHMALAACTVSCGALQRYTSCTTGTMLGYADGHNTTSCQAYCQQFQQSGCCVFLNDTSYRCWAYAAPASTTAATGSFSNNLYAANCL